MITVIILCFIGIASGFIVWIGAEYLQTRINDHSQAELDELSRELQRKVRLDELYQLQRYLQNIEAPEQVVMHVGNRIGELEGVSGE